MHHYNNILMSAVVPAIYPETAIYVDLLDDYNDDSDNHLVLLQLSFWNALQLSPLANIERL